MKDYPLGRIGGFRVSADPSALAGAPLLWAALAAGVRAMGVPWGRAVRVGLVTSGVHWASELWHQGGHAVAARSTGYPMTGLRFWTILSASVYPADEPALPARIHIRRALGGPLASALLTVALGLLWWTTPRTQHRRHALARFAFWENLIVFTLGALVPLGFNDGSSLRHWWGKRSAEC
jgi:hypothetical protein